MRRFEFIGDFAGDPRARDIERMNVMFEAVIQRGNRIRVKCIGLDDVGAGFEIRALNRLHDVRRRDVQHIEVARAGRCGCFRNWEPRNVASSSCCAWSIVPMAPSKMTILSFRRFLSAAIRVSLRSNDSLPLSSFATAKSKAARPKTTAAASTKPISGFAVCFRRGRSVPRFSGRIGHLSVHIDPSPFPRMDGSIQSATRTDPGFLHTA